MIFQRRKKENHQGNAITYVIYIARKFRKPKKISYRNNTRAEFSQLVMRKTFFLRVRFFRLTCVYIDSFADIVFAYFPFLLYVYVYAIVLPCMLGLLNIDAKIVIDHWVYWISVRCQYRNFFTVNVWNCNWKLYIYIWWNFVPFGYINTCESFLKISWNTIFAEQTFHGWKILYESCVLEVFRFRVILWHRKVPRKIHIYERILNFVSFPLETISSNNIIYYFRISTYRLAVRRISDRRLCCSISQDFWYFCYPSLSDCRL